MWSVYKHTHTPKCAHGGEWHISTQVYTHTCVHAQVCICMCTRRHEHGDTNTHRHAWAPWAFTCRCMFRGTHKHLHSPCTQHREMASQDHLEQFRHLPQKEWTFLNVLRSVAFKSAVLTTGLIRAQDRSRLGEEQSGEARVVYSNLFWWTLSHRLLWVCIHSVLFFVFFLKNGFCKRIFGNYLILDTVAIYKTSSETTSLHRRRQKHQISWS